MSKQKNIPPRPAVWDTQPQVENIHTFSPAGTEPDPLAVRQLEQCLAVGDEGDMGVLCADHHAGYSQPIGGVVAYENYVSPTGVGFDIGCGNKAVATSLFLGDIKSDLPRIMDEITRRISFGMGQPAAEAVDDHPVFDRINRDSPIPGQRNLLGLASKQLGTVGGGNHYVDLFAEDGTDRIWIGVHFGSRGFGHKTASGFLALGQGLGFDEHAKEGEMNSPPLIFHKDSPLGHLYIEAMTIAGEYAYAGRDVVVNKVLDILGNPAVFNEVHNHHNFAWLEEHDGRTFWVIRKGATPLAPGQQGFVGANMMDNAVIIEGVMPTNQPQVHFGDASLWSAPHGAGRIMSRTEAKGKSRKRWACHNCGNHQEPGEPGWIDGCPECHSVADVGKRWVQESEGKIDWKAAQREVKRRGIELRGAEADEAPGAYKKLSEVIAAHGPYVAVTHTLRPIGVAMAGSGVVDKYKD